MATPNLQELKYGIIYLYSDRNLSTGFYHPESVIERFVRPMQVVWVDEPGRRDLLMIARRFNVGNIGQYATVSLSLTRMDRSGAWFEAIRRFADILMGVADASDGDIVLDEDDFGHQYDAHSAVFDLNLKQTEAAPQDHTRVESSRRDGLWRRFARRTRNLLAEDECCVCDAQSAPASCDQDSEVPELDLLQECEGRELDVMERERKQSLERIKHEIVSYIARYHEDPKELIAQLLRGKVVVGQPGRLLVNGDMKIVLPEYDETEIEMPALCRTLYILFMKLRRQGEGIVLKNIIDYRDEILGIYAMVKPGASQQRVKLSVDNLCDPLSDSLNQTISRINRCVKNVITDKELVKKYTVTGKKGEPYSIALEPEYLELPRAVTGD